MDIVQALRRCLADSFLMYFKAHSYHWNVEGIHFSQYHDFFGDIYAEVYAAVDDIAERIRIQGAYAPISLAELYRDNSVIEDAAMPLTCRDMVIKLDQANTIVLRSLNAAFAIASEQDNQGLADYLAGRIDSHNKHSWMLKASMKEGYDGANR